MTPRNRRDSYFIKKEQLGEEIVDLQGLVQDMKDGFTGAMQELARIQSGDQIMRATVEKNRQDCQKGSEDLTKELENLKSEVRHALEDFKSGQDTLKKLTDEISELRKNQECIEDQLKRPCRCVSQGDQSETSVGPSNEVVLGTMPQLPLPRVSPMLQTFIQSLSKPMDTPKDTSLCVATENNLSSIFHKPTTPTPPGDATQTKDHISRQASHSCQQDDRFLLGSELLVNERQYQDDLYFLTEKMRQPLLEQNIIPKEDVNVIFPSVLSLIREKHKTLSEALERRLDNWEQHNTLGEIYARITSANEKMIEKYRQYVRGFPSCVSRFGFYLQSSPEFASFIQETLSNNYPNYSNPNRIIFAPLHRIPYYVQHIKMLDEITDKDHPDHFHLTSSLKQLKQIVKKINVLVKKNKDGDDYKGSKPANDKYEAEICSKVSERLEDPSEYATKFPSPLTVKPPTVTVKPNVNIETALPKNESFDNNADGGIPKTPNDGRTGPQVDDLLNAVSNTDDPVNPKELPIRRFAGRRRSLSGFMLEIPEEASSDVTLVRRSLSPTLLNRFRIDDPCKDGAIKDEETQSTLSSINDESMDGVTKTVSSTMSESLSDEDVDDLSQEEVELIDKQFSDNRRQIANAFSDMKPPQRVSSFKVYGDLDWKGEGGEYVPSVIEMNIHETKSHDRWKNNPALQPETKQSDKTESEYHTSDDEPIPFNSPMYNDIEQSTMKRYMDLEKRRRSSLGDLMVIPPQREDNSLLIHWDNMDSTSDDTQDENSTDQNTAMTTEKQFTAVSNQRRKFGMRRRRSIDAGTTSDRGQKTGAEPSASPRVSWADDKTSHNRTGQSNSKEGSPTKRQVLTNVFKRVSNNNNGRATKSSGEQRVYQDVMEQLADIARMIVESSGDHKEPCSDV